MWFLDGLRAVSIKVYSVELMQTASRHWLKERTVFTQNVFVFQAQTILEVNAIFCAISLLEFVSKRLCIEMPGFPSKDGS